MTRHIVNFAFAFAIYYVGLRYVLHVGHDLTIVGAWVLALVAEANDTLARIEKAARCATDR